MSMTDGERKLLSATIDALERAVARLDDLIKGLRRQETQMEALVQDVRRLEEAFRAHEALAVHPIPRARHGR